MINVGGSSSASDGGASQTGFGEQLVAQNTAFVQSVPSYGLLPANFRSYTAAGGSAGVENTMFSTNTGTSAGGYGAVQSFRALNYKAGEAGLARFTGVFTQGVANSWQGVGLINLGDELSFGYNGVDFGVWHRHNGKAEVRTLTVTGAAGGSENASLVLNGASAETIPLTAGTVQHNAYEIADYINTNVDGWNADHLDDTVIMSAGSDGAKSNTYSFSSSTATATIVQTTAGVTKTSDFTTQANWNQNTFSSLDPTQGNVYQIRFQYLGFGNIYFDVENPDTGRFECVHIIKWSNANTVPSLGNPSLRAGVYCVNLTNTTDLNVKVGSFGLFTQGKVVSTRNPRALKFTQSVDNTGFTNILTLRNRRTYNGEINQVEIEPRFLTLAAEGSKNIEFELRSTTDPGVELSFNTVGNNLVGDLATNSVAITVGRSLGAFTVAGGTSIAINLKELDIRLPPSLNFSVAAKVTGSGAAVDATAALTYYEDL